MTHCAKCGAELIGSRKFCAACGAPAGDPRSPAASTGLAPVMSGRVPGAPGSAPSAPGSAPGSSPGAGAGNSGSNPGSGPSIQYAPAPASQVNPFAQTAGPLTNRQQASDYGPPPSIPSDLGSTTKGVGAPVAAPQVSPLAVSNVSSSRGAFENAVTSGPASTAAVAAGLTGVITHPDHDPSSHGSTAKRSPVAGTQMMPSAANPASAKRPDRTQMLGAFTPGNVPRPGAPPSAGAAPPAPPVSPVAKSTGAPSAGALPAADPQRISSVPNIATASPYAAAQPPAPQAHQPPPPVAQAPQLTAPMQPQPPVQPPPPAWSPAAAPYGNPQAPQAPQPPSYAQPSPYAQPPMAPPQAPPYAYGTLGFAYMPGSRVTVTWSNGGRYPGTVQQVSGTQCLVVFPDGQQHWVEMQYVAPA
jgi:hypothetical protein